MNKRRLLRMVAMMLMVELIITSVPTSVLNVYAAPSTEDEIVDNNIAGEVRGYEAGGEIDSEKDEIFFDDETINEIQESINRASSDPVKSGECGYSATWELYLLEDGYYELVIAGEGAISYSNLRSPWESEKSRIIKVTIGSGIRGIGDSAFSGCYSLTSIEIPSSVMRIGNSAFKYCSSLTSIELPGGVTSIGNCAFMGCRSLTSIKIPGGVTRIESCMFMDCTSLTSIELPSGVWSIGNSAFENCNSLTSIEIPEWVSVIGDSAFSGCYSLTSIELPDGVESIGSKAFCNCRNLGKIYIPKSVNTIDGSSYDNAPFYDCFRGLVIFCEAEEEPSGWGNEWNNYGSLYLEYTTYFGIGREEYVFWNSLDKESEKIVIPDSYTFVPAYGFRGLKNLKEVLIPDSVTSIGECAFYHCDNLERIYIPDSVNTIAYSSFNDCSHDLVIYCEAEEKPSGWESNWNNNKPVNYGISREEYDFWNSLDKESEKIVIPSYCKYIPKYAFRDFKNLKEVSIPDSNSITGIGERAFSGCSSLAGIEIPSSVRSIGKFAFEDCTSLTDIEIPSSVTSLGEFAFSGCSSLASIEIPSSVTRIGRYILRDCTSLTCIEIPSGITGIDEGAFNNCSNLKSIYIPDSVKNIGDSSYYDYSPFFKCSSDLVIYCEAEEKPSGWKTYWNNYNRYDNLAVNFGITREEFKFWSGLDSEDEEEEIPGNYTSIPNGAFQNFTSLEKVTIPDSVTSIGDSTFSGCTSLVNIELPDHLTSIGEYAFKGCSSLKTFYIPESVEEIKGSSSFEGCSNIIFYCEAEEKPEGWGEYWNVNRPVYYDFSREDYLLKLEKEVTIPMTCTSISADYFDGYINLETLVVPNCIISISSDSFSNCTSLSDVYYFGTKEKWEEIYKGDLPASKLHFMEEKEAVEPTCVLAGNEKYYILRNEFYEDSEGKSKIEDLTAWKGKGGKGYIAPIGHNLSTTYEKENADAENHYHICMVCDEKDEGEAHIWNQEAATEQEDKHCKICGYVAEEKLSPHVHAGTKVAGKDSTCTEDGMKEYFICECGQAFTEEECEKPIEDLDGWKVIPALGHNLTIVRYDDECHWKECERCGYLDDRKKHKFDSDNGKICGECSFVNGLLIEIVDEQEAYTYTGSAIKPSIVVKNYGKVLTEGVDYTVSYKNNVKVSFGVANNKKPVIIVKGKGNYSGTTQKTFEIIPCSLNDVTIGTVTVVKGSKATPILMHNGYRLGTKDYVNLDAARKFDADTTIKLTGKGNYTGSREVQIRVVATKSELKKFTVILGNEKLYYDGTEKKISYTVMDSVTQKPIEEGNYIVTYAGDTINAGTVKVTFTGIGEYTGSVVKSYAIQPSVLPVGKALVSGINPLGYDYNPNVVKPEKDIVVTYWSGEQPRILEQGKDYTITFANYGKISTAKAPAKYTIKFIGNYKGTKAMTGNYKINPMVLDEATPDLKISIPDMVYTGKPGTYISKPVISIGNALLNVKRRIESGGNGGLFSAKLPL